MSSNKVFISWEELNEWSSEIYIERRKKIGATENFYQQLKDLYYGVNEYTTVGGFILKYNGQTFPLNPGSCLYEEELFWYYTCFLGMRALQIKNDFRKEIPKAQEYVKEHAAEYDMQEEVTKLFLVGKSPYARPSQEEIDHLSNLDALNKQFTNMEKNNA